jgi:phosphate-selective porin
MTKIVQSILALAVSSSVVLAQGWSGAPGKGLKYDGGDAFSFKMENRLQTHWVYGHNENAADTNNFTVRRARTAFSGHAFNKGIRYYLQVDAVDNDSNLKDGFVTWDFMSNESGTIGLQMGQAKTLFGLESAGSSKYLGFVERSDASRTFADRRSRGLWLLGSHMENKLRWSVAAMNGSTSQVGYVTGESANNDDDELSFVATVNFDPMGDIMGGKDNRGFKQGDFREGDRSLAGTIGLGFGMENATANVGTIPAPVLVDAENTALNFNTAWSIEGFQVLGEWFSWTTEIDGAGVDPETDGFYLSGTYVLPKSGDSGIQWGVGARFGTMDMTEVGGDEITDIALVANAFYHGHACKTQIEILQRDYDNADVTDYQISLAFQLIF